jgi:hypothetical protein
MVNVRVTEVPKGAVAAENDLTMDGGATTIFTTAGLD